MAADDFKQLADSLHVDNHNISDIAHSIFILCRYDPQAFQNKYQPFMHRRLPKPQIFNNSIEIAVPISDCPHQLLKYCLLLYGFTDEFKLFSLLTIWRIFIFLCLCFGYYALAEIDPNQYKSNHSADYIVIALEDVLYPGLYIIMQIYFSQKKHFWILCSDKSTAFTRKLSQYLTRVLLLSIFISITAATLQKWSWANAHKITWSNTDTLTLIIYFGFYITFIIRLFELFLLSIIFVIISKFHHQQIISFINKFTLTNIIINKKNKQSMTNTLHLNESNQSMENFDLTESNISNNNNDMILRNRDNNNGNNNKGNKQNMMKLRGHCNMEDLFKIYASIRVDILHTNNNISWFLILFYLAIIIDLILFVVGSLFRFVDFGIFIDNASDLFIMMGLALYILYSAASVTEEFNGISNKALRLYHYESAFIGWNLNDLVKLFGYFDQTKQGFKLSGILLNYSTCIVFVVFLGIGILTTLGRL